MLEGLLHDSPLLELFDLTDALDLFGRQRIGGDNACDGDRGDQDARGREGTTEAERHSVMDSNEAQGRRGRAVWSG